MEAGSLVAHVGAGERVAAVGGDAGRGRAPELGAVGQLDGAHGAFVDEGGHRVAAGERGGGQPEVPEGDGGDEPGAARAEGQPAGQRIEVGHHEQGRAAGLGAARVGVEVAALGEGGESLGVGGGGVSGHGNRGRGGDHRGARRAGLRRRAHRSVRGAVRSGKERETDRDGDGNQPGR